MTNGIFKISIAWGNRKQSILECCQEMIVFMNSFSNLAPQYSEISLLMNEDEKDHKINLNNYNDKLVLNTAENYILANEKEIKKYNNIGTITPSFCEKVGFRLWFYSGENSEDRFTVIAQIGAFNWEHKYPNNITIEFPFNYSNNFSFFYKVLEKLILQFKPIKGGVYPNFVDRIKNNPKEFPGWISYYEKDYNLPVVPDFIEKIKINDLGNIYILTREDYDIQNQNHNEKWKAFYLKYIAKDN